MASIINGKELSENILTNIKNQLLEFGDEKFDLVVITIGDDPASKVYVNNKKKACEKVGLGFHNERFSSKDVFWDIGHYIEELNQSKNVKGIILQLPIVSDILTEGEKQKLTKMISPSKDVDGFLVNSAFTPCTPKGILRLLDTVRTQDGNGRIALVIGRSDIVGKPIAKLLLDRNYTVIQAHSKTQKERLLRLFSIADVIISAVGKPNLITEEDAYQYFKDNRHDFYGNLENNKDRVIIDVGINRDSEGKLCGDFSEEFKQKYSEYYTPVPGGVGPMTVAMLVENTYESISKISGILKALHRLYKQCDSKDLN